MTALGYTMKCEQSRPDQLVGGVRLAEEAGFDFWARPPRRPSGSRR